jgi:tetratricopeptide (TPR) repeat protein
MSPRSRRPFDGLFSGWLLSLLAPLLLSACGSTRLSLWTPTPGPYDRFSAAQLKDLAQARAQLSSEDVAGAIAGLSELTRQDPQNLTVAAVLQDAELAALERGLRLPNLEQDLEPGQRGPDAGPRTRLRRWYAWRAEQRGTSFELVLAARIEDDALAALRLLDRAAEVDPQNVWAHYGRAHVLLQLNRLEEARGALGRALELDPGHPRVRRLESAVLGLGKNPTLAKRSLRTWLLEVEQDARIARREWLDGALDLVGLELAEERYQESLNLLESLAVETPEQGWRLELYRAVAEDGLGRYEAALASARRAQQLRPAGFRAFAQEALLHQHRFNNLEAAVAAWEQAAELANQAAGGGLDGDAGALELQARIEAARLRARLALDRPTGESNGSSAQVPADGAQAPGPIR